MKSPAPVTTYEMARSAFVAVDCFENFSNVEKIIVRINVYLCPESVVIDVKLEVVFAV